MRRRVFSVTAGLGLALSCQCSLFVGTDGLDSNQTLGLDVAPAPLDSGSIDEFLPVAEKDAGILPAETGDPEDAAEVDATSGPDAGTDVVVSDVGPEAADDSPYEAASDAGGNAVDSAPPPPPCDPKKAFGSPVLVQGLQSSATEGSLRLLPDELTGFFWSSRAGGPGTDNLFVTMRSEKTKPFGTASLLNNVNAVGMQLDPSVSSDGLTLVFRSGRFGGPGGYDLYSATRPDRASDFSNVALVSGLNTTFNEVQPFLMPDGSEIYFSSDRTGDYGVFRSVAFKGKFGTATAVTEVNVSAVPDQNPAASADDLSLFISSGRPGGSGNQDIWLAQRSQAGSPFAAPVNVAEVNSAANDYPSWVSPDHCRLYLQSDRSGGTHIYVAVRPQ